MGGGVSRLLSWQANFSAASPGTHLISFIAENASGQTRVIKKIFVTRVTFNSATKTFSAETPEGLIQVRYQDLIAPKDNCCKQERHLPSVADNDQGSLINQVGQIFRGHDSNFKLCPPGYLPHDMEVVWTPTPAFSGQYGDLPFQDPWWKVLLLIVAAILAIAGAIAEAAGGTGDVTVSGSGSTDGTPNCCGVQAEGGGTNYVAAGLLAAAAAVATAAGLSDVRDPVRRGQDNTKPAPGEMTTGEQLKISLAYPEPVALGRSFAVGAKWEYTSITTGKSYTYAVSEVNHNVHVISKYEITAPNVVRSYKREPFIVKGQFFGQDNKLFRGDQLFVQCFLVGPNGQFASFVMQDDGSGGRFGDETALDGVYTGGFQFTVEDRGLWMFFVIAQDINTAQPNLTPEEAAQIIGGFVLTHQLTITLGGGTCPLVPDGDVNVI